MTTTRETSGKDAVLPVPAFQPEKCSHHDIQGGRDERHASHQVKQNV